MSDPYDDERPEWARLKGEAPGHRVPPPDPNSANQRGRDAFHRYDAQIAGSNAMLPLGDEVEGIKSALLDRGESEGFIEAYRRGRDTERRRVETLKRQQPEEYAEGELRGLAASFALPGPKPGLANTIKYGLGLGGIQAAGGSEADLTSGQPAQLGQFLGDVAGGAEDAALIAAGAHGAGRLAKTASASRPAQWIGDQLAKPGRWAAGKLSDAERAAAEFISGKAQHGMRTARSELGQSVQDAHRRLEIARDTLADDMASAAEKSEATKALEQARDSGLLSNIRSNAFERSSDDLGRISQKRELYDAAKAASSEEAVTRALDDYLAHPIKKEVLPRLKTYATRAIPQMLPLDPASKFVLSATMGDPGTSASKMMRAPTFRVMSSEAFNWLLNTAPEKLGRFAPQLKEAAAAGPMALAVRHYVLHGQVPEYKNMIDRLQSGEDTDERPEWAR